MVADDASSPLRSAWLKWARAVEHANVLARATREWQASDPHRYERSDRVSSFYERGLQVEWRLRIEHPIPERWSVLIGDVLTNLRGALDHAFWAAVNAHSGQPERPSRIQFPIDASRRDFKNHAKELQELVPADVWQLIEQAQPFHWDADASAHPLERLRWLSNMDKHRFLHVINMVQLPLGSTVVEAEPEMPVLSEWRQEGPVEAGDVLLRLVLRRPDEATEVVLRPMFAAAPSLQVHDSPDHFVHLAAAMDPPKDWVLNILAGFTSIMQLPYPDSAGLELGLAHAEALPQFGQGVLRVSGEDGSRQTHHFDVSELLDRPPSTRAGAE